MLKKLQIDLSKALGNNRKEISMGAKSAMEARMKQWEKKAEKEGKNHQ